MKNTFTKEYILSNRGCYDREEVEGLKFINQKTIKLKTLFNNLPIKDFTWFLVRHCDLTLREKRYFSLHCAKQVLPIFEKKHPKDNRVRDCIEATESYLEGKITVDELREKRREAFYAAADAAYAATAAAADAADAAADDSFKKSIRKFILTLEN